MLSRKILNNRKRTRGRRVYHVPVQKEKETEVIYHTPENKKKRKKVKTGIKIKYIVRSSHLFRFIPD